MDFINRNKIISATINEPYENSGESFDMSSTHGWQISFHVGYIDGFPDTIMIDMDSREDCVNLAKRLGLDAL